ncbi:unnamed protein product [Musa textilis]
MLCVILIEPEFHWWDQVDEFLLLGAVPFPTDVPRLKQLGVHGVITLNEPYETLVPALLYLAHGIEHMLIPNTNKRLTFCSITWRYMPSCGLQPWPSKTTTISGCKK